MSLAQRKIYSGAEIVRETGIPQKELAILLEHYGDRIPTLMDGERRRFPPESIKELKRAWREYHSSIEEVRESSSEWFSALMAELESAGEELAKAGAKLKRMQKELRRNPPLRTFYINGLPGPDFDLLRPIAALVDPSNRPLRAFLDDSGLSAEGGNAKEAVINLREVIIRTFARMEDQNPSEREDEAQFALLATLIRRRNHDAVPRKKK
jgi:DNA-binding transcriptional MerR regulator